MDKHESTQPKRGAKTRKTATMEVEGVIVGRDKTVVPPNEVTKLAAIGSKDLEIAQWFGITEDTLRYNFATELMLGREALKHSLRRAQIQLALTGNPTMLIWLGKVILLQQENPVDNEANQPLPWTDLE